MRRTLEEIRERLERFEHREVFLHQYIEFGRILRIRIAHSVEDDWFLSFGECQSIRSPVQWQLGSIRFTHATPESLIVEDTMNDFRVVCMRCALITQDEYADVYIRAKKYRLAWEQANRDDFE